MDVGEKQELRILILCRNPGLELLKYVQLGELRLGFVQIVEILPSPAKRLPFRVLDAARVHAALLKDVFVFSSEVFAHDRDHAHIGEITGGERKVSRRAADNIVGASGGSSDVVKSDGTNGEYAHLTRWVFSWGVLAFNGSGLPTPHRRD